MMNRINILCEGPTEEEFINQVLYPHFLAKNIVVTPRRLDGNCGYDRVKDECRLWLNAEPNAVVTTMIDYYGRKKPSAYPGVNPSQAELLEQVKTIEAAMYNQIVNNPKVHNKRLVPYLQLHELEALLFADPDTMTEWLSIDHAIPENAFRQIAEQFPSPEHINNNLATAPSKRIIQHAPSYSKVVEGPMILSAIGLAKIRAACPHFDEWITTLENYFPKP